MTTENPLTETQYRDINRMLAAINAYILKCDRAESAGLDCEADRAALRFYDDRLNKLKATYFPGKP